MFDTHRATVPCTISKRAQSHGSRDLALLGDAPRSPALPLFWVLLPFSSYDLGVEWGAVF